MDMLKVFNNWYAYFLGCDGIMVLFIFPISYNNSKQVDFIVWSTLSLIVYFDAISYLT